MIKCNFERAHIHPIFFKIIGADIRHTPHGSPQATFKYGNAAPIGGYSPNIESLLVSRGGDCEVIEQYVFALFAECSCKYTKRFRFKKILLLFF